MSLTVEHVELPGSPSEQYTATGFTATRRFMCKWSQRHKLARQLQKGYGVAYPYNAAARVTAVAIAPFHADGIKETIDIRKASYDDAVLTVTYKTPDGYSGVDSDDPDTLISETVEPWTEFLTLPGRKLWWGNSLETHVGPQQSTVLGDEASPGMLVRGLDWKITLYNLHSIPQIWYDMIGNVNSDQLKSKTLNMTFEPETLLYNPPSLQRVITSEGIKAWTVNLTLAHRQTGWNKFYNVKSSEWQSVFDSKNTQDTNPKEVKIYTPTTFKDKLGWKW